MIYNGYEIRTIEKQHGLATIITRAVYKNNIEICKALTVEQAKEKINKLIKQMVVA
jgi:hypothetical protein